MASMVFGSIGSSLLGPLGGWLGSALGSYVDNMLFAAGGADQEGQRINDINVSRADPGVPIPLLYGADRLAGILVASTPLIETVHKERVGKGGGPEIITYTYHVDVDYMLCEGPILGIARVWAEGNLVRATRYELEVSTSEYPENIGGIPYPSYYKKHLYYPSEIPWSLDVSESPNSTNNDGNYYTSSDNRESMRKISESEALQYIENRQRIVYWRDTTSGYYIPFHEDHGYEPSKDKKEDNKAAHNIQTNYFPSEGNFNSSPRTTVYELPRFYNMMNKLTRGRIFGGGSIALEFMSWPYVETSIGLPGGPREMTFSFAFYKDGEINEVDGVKLGAWIGSASKSIHIEASTPVFTRIDGITFPAETAFIVLTCSYALWFPVVGLGLEVADPTMYINYLISSGDDDDIRDWPDYWNLYDAINDFSKTAVLAFKGCEDLVVYHGTMDQHQSPVMTEALEQEVPAYIGRAHVVFKTLQLAEYGNRVPNLSFECVQFDDVRIADVIRDIMTRATVEPKYYDVEELPDSGVESHVLGYSIGNQITYRSALETMNEAFHIDCAEIGDQIVFRPKDRDTDFEIDMSELGAMEPGRNIEELIEFKYRDRLEMPRTLTVRFKDVERHYQTNTAMYQRQQTPSVQQSTVELASVLPPAIAKAYARDKMRDIWLERVSVSFKLPHKYVYVGASDIITLRGASVGKPDISIKITGKTRGVNNVIEIEGVLRDLHRYIPVAGEVTNSNMDVGLWNQDNPRDNYTNYPTRMALLDIPPLRNADVDKPGFYAALNADIGWDGGVITRAIPPDNAEWSTVMSTPYRAIYGQVSLSSKLLPAIAELPDMDGFIYVDLIALDQQLVNATFNEICMGKNLALVGDELIQFMNAEKVVTPAHTNRWRISTLFRGRRLTDRSEILNNHTYGEQFLLIDTVTITSIEDDISNLSKMLTYSATSVQGDGTPTDMTVFSWSFERGKRPAPVYITGERDVSDNLEIKWIKQDIGILPLYENANALGSDTSLQFEVEIYNGNSIVRTIVKSAVDSYNDQLGEDGFQTLTYSAADQIADGLTPGNPVKVAIYQVSTQLGRGYAGIAEV